MFTVRKPCGAPGGTAGLGGGGGGGKTWRCAGGPPIGGGGGGGGGASMNAGPNLSEYDLSLATHGGGASAGAGGGESGANCGSGGSAPGGEVAGGATGGAGGGIVFIWALEARLEGIPAVSARGGPGGAGGAGKDQDGCGFDDGGGGGGQGGQGGTGGTILLAARTMSAGNGGLVATGGARRQRRQRREGLRRRGRRFWGNGCSAGFLAGKRRGRSLRRGRGSGWWRRCGRVRGAERPDPSGVRDPERDRTRDTTGRRGGDEHHVGPVVVAGCMGPVRPRHLPGADRSVLDPGGGLRRGGT